MKTYHHLLTVGLTAYLFSFTSAKAEAPVQAAQEAGKPALQAGNAKIVLVGDSIISLVRRLGERLYAYQLEDALKATYPESSPNIIALGGGGQGIASWTNVEKQSREKPGQLDIKGIDVKQTLDQHADVLVIMLGMNDALAPHVSDDPKALDLWQSQYVQLVEALRARLSPRVIGLARVTPASEDLTSPKNKLIASLNERLPEIAKTVGARVLPAGDTVQEILKSGRELRPDFHVTMDFVHPNEAGHIGIAIGMLKGLGEDNAAGWLRKERLSKIWKSAVGDKPSISWEVTPLPAASSSEVQAFRVRYWWANPAANNPPRVQLTAPQGWKVSPQSLTGPSGEFTATGTPDQIQNILTLEGSANNEQRKVQLTIPAPWLVAAKLIQRQWANLDFQADKAVTPVDQAIEAGTDFTGSLDVGQGQVLSWQRHFPSVNFTGKDDPASMDFTAISITNTFEAGYGARWIHSDRARDVLLKLDSKIFAGNMFLTVWINGAVVYRGMLTAESPRPKVVPAKLQQGNNVLVFKANHRDWQSQVMVGLAPVEGDSLADLRYATTPSRR